MELKKYELEQVQGGAISSSLINAITKATNAVYSLGKQLGSSIRRLTTGQYCSVN